jgi:hypothetical protein
MIQVIDAVMGTGKSSWVIKMINQNPAQKYIVLVPSLTEITRYKEELSADHNGTRNDIVALDEEGGPSKKPQFIKAVEEEKTVIVTHELFSRLSKRDFQLLPNLKDYNLVIDETITLVSKKYISDADLKALIDDGYMETVDDPDIDGLQFYSLLDKGREYIGNEGKGLRETIDAVSGKHIYKVNSHNIVFVVPPEKLTIFQQFPEKF